ncbi:hypothetical protein D1B33_14730 [Lysinibacillus yapensis]|uniref:Uncharacterized protein n=1 Tax=Ureibacillus yapensis TaxID=2304605 RepID=A0A396S4H8_9BACL|nr:hypothetical protein [Lysinibacillus yapensis]RHW34049.1 hypothetical protein D1B33_14730 [Lysinibacillus yapensis]
MSIKKITPVQGVVIFGLLSLMVFAILIASQFYLSYTEVTKAANSCFNIGGYPIIQKTGLEMTYFECVKN